MPKEKNKESENLRERTVVFAWLLSFLSLLKQLCMEDSIYLLIIE